MQTRLLSCPQRIEGAEYINWGWTTKGRGQGVTITTPEWASDQ